MTLTLYNISASRNRIDKPLGDGVTINGIMKNALDVDNIRVDLEQPVKNFNYNYCYIPELKRYYFIGTPVVLPNNVVTLPLECDVLMSFKNTIDNIVGTVTKGADPDKYNSDFQAPVDVRPVTEKQIFTNGFNTEGYIIMVTIRGNISS